MICWMLLSSLFPVGFAANTFVVMAIPELNGVTQPGHTLEVDVRAKTPDASLHCSRICKKNGCVSFVLDNAQMKCFFFEKVFVVGSTSNIELPGASYYLRTTEVYKPGEFFFLYRPDKRYAWKIYQYPENNWAGAKTECESQDGELLRMNDAESVEIFNDVQDRYPDAIEMGTDFDKFWINGYLTSGTWEYTDGTSITYFNWNTNEPDGGNLCLSIWHHPNDAAFDPSRWLFGDYSCGVETGYVCMYQVP